VKKNTILLLSAVLCAVQLYGAEPVKEMPSEIKSDSGNQTELSYYKNSYIVAVDRKLLDQIIGQTLTMAAGKLPSITAWVECAKTAGYNRCSMLEARLEIVKRLVEYIKEHQAVNNSPEAILFAGQGARELKQLIDYFDVESRIFEKSQAAITVKTISVKDFGAMGDGQNDDAAAIRKAIEAAAQIEGGARILIPSGNYRLGSLNRINPAVNVRDTLQVNAPVIENGDPNWQSGHLVLLNLDNVTIEGEKNTNLLPQDSTQTAIKIVGCQNVTIKNINIDYPNLVFCQGEIVAADPQASKVLWKLDRNYPDPSQPRFINAPQRLGTLHEKDRGNFVWKAEDIFFGKIKKRDDNLFELEIPYRSSLPRQFEEFTPGRRIVISARYDQYGSAVALNNSSFCNVEDITINSSPGIAFMLWRNNAIKVTNCKIATPEKSTRLISTNGDGIQSVNSIIGPFIENCNFSRMHDDGVMVSTRSSKIIAVDSADPRKILTNNIVFAPGLNGAVLDPLTGQIKAEAICSSLKLAARWKSSSGTEFYFDAPLKIDTTMENFAGRELTHKEMIDYYTGIKPFTKQPDLILCTDFSDAGTVVRNNKFASHRGTGIKIQGTNAIVENNQLSDIQGVGIAVSAIMAWGEPLTPHNVLIRKNNVSDSAVGVATHYTLFKGDALSRPVNRILIEDNRFINQRRAAVHLGNCANVEVKNNVFDSPGLNKAISTGSVKNLTFTGNKFSFASQNPADFMAVSSMAENLSIDGAKF
jgi:hypothetical protein